nr:App1 family protein [Marinigracilibium pacificum]
MIFYISNSEMNLFLLISTFITKHDFPKGPLFLNEYKVVKQFFKRKDKNRDHDFHKFRSIMFVMNLMKDTKFILVGDNSQHDPEIYHEIANKYPDRVKAILIRKYNQKSKRSDELKSLKEDLTDLNIPLIIGKDGAELWTKYESQIHTVS